MALLFSISVALALAVATIFAPISWLAAGIIWAITSLLGLLIAARHHRHLVVVADYLDARRDDLPPQDFPNSQRPLQSLANEPGPVSEIGRQLDLMVRQVVEHSGEVSTDLYRKSAVLEALSTPLILLDTRARIEWVNGASSAMFGHQIIGRDLSTIIRHPEILHIVETISNTTPALSSEITLVDSARPAMDARIEGRWIDAAGWSGCLLSITDLSEVRKAERMRADFIANASHELRTPLATLLGFVETLQGPARDDAKARDQFLDIMDNQAKRMSRLVEDLLSLSRIEANEHSMPKDSVALGQVLETVRDSLQIEAERRDIDVSLEVAEGLPPVLGAADELAQVAQNLVENAIKYGRPGTPVSITAELTQELPAAYPTGAGREAVLLCVRDQGDGIPREHLPRLTERFYRVDTARSRELGGTGLGLAIVKHIVSRHRGVLTIDSEPGHGSTFHVYLPPDTNL